MTVTYSMHTHTEGTSDSQHAEELHLSCASTTFTVKTDNMSSSVSSEPFQRHHSLHSVTGLYTASAGESF